MDTKVLSRIRSCFDYRGMNMSTAHPVNKDKVRFIAGPPWDIIWADIETNGKKFNLSFEMRGGSGKVHHRQDGITMTELIKTLRFFRG